MSLTVYFVFATALHPSGTYCTDVGPECKDFCGPFVDSALLTLVGAPPDPNESLIQLC